MAAPAVFPITTFPHSEPAVSAQAAKTSTCCASIRGAPGRRFSSTPNSLTREEPIVNHLRSFLEAAAVKPPSQSDLPQFTVGMHMKDGVAKRLEWKALESEISRAEAVTAQTKSGLSPRARQRYLLDLRRSVSNAIYELLKDERCEDEDMRSFWSDPQNARKAIAQDAVTEYVRKLRSKPEEGYRYPVIILATEKAGFQIDQEPIVPATKGEEGNLKGDHIQFLETWREAVTGDAEVLTVVGDSADSIKGSLEAVLEGSDHHWVSTPTLIVMYASYDSAITANLSSIRRLCDANGIKLCLEGPGLAFLGQAARPSDPNECLQHADVLLTNPGSWFGFEECAFTSIHSTHHFSSYNKPEYGHGANDSTVISSIQREDQQQENAVAYVTKLWTILSQIGVPRIRQKVDAVTHIAEALIYELRDCQSLATSYEGVGCIARLSYELSTSERGFSKIEEAEILSAINRSLYNFVAAEARELQVFLVKVDNISLLQFSPLRLLNSRTFWVPGDEQIRKFSHALRQRAEFYRLCRTGALVFMERVALCSGIELLEDNEVTEDVLHWYGAFRVVPGEWQGAWGKSSSGRHAVTTVTKMFVSELSESFASIVMCSPSLKQLLESCSFDAREKSKAISRNGINQQKVVNPLQYILGRRSTASNKSIAQSVIDLPFSFYIHYDDATFNAPFVSVEPKCTYPINRAYRHACTAAEIIVAVLQVVLRKYRSKGCVESPNHDIVSNSTEREEAPLQPPFVGRSTIGQPKYSEASKADGGSLEDSEISGTEVNENDDGGFVSASSTLRTKILQTDAVDHNVHHRAESNTHGDQENCRNAIAKDTGIGQLRNGRESPGKEMSNENISITGPPRSASSATCTQLAQGAQRRIPWLEYVTTEHLSSDADSEGSDDEYSEDEYCSLTEEDRSLSEDGSDYQDTDSSDQASDSESSEDESSENESSKSSADEEYSGGEDDTSGSSSSSSDAGGDHDNLILGPARDSNTEAEAAPELLKNNITRSAWLPSWLGSRYVQAPLAKTTAEVQNSSRTRGDTKTDSARSIAPSKSTHSLTSCSSSETDECESATSDDTRQSSSTECSDVSPSGSYGKSRNRRRRSKHRSSRTLKTSRPWRWWKQRQSASSESEETCTSSEDQRNRRSNDDDATSLSDDSDSAFPDAFSIPSSEYSSTRSQESYSEGGSETKESSSSSSSTSSNPSNEEVEGQRSSRSRDSSSNAQPSRRYWFPYFCNYGLSGRGNSEESKGLVRAEEKPRSLTRRGRH
ncbi:hypothetical protein FGB62_12g343 [Gracilaria domingensis]|nr:hypothetical protein FGB62_12g343 [Gracilaria domingensis]